MKVIAIVSDKFDREYVCTVTHRELEKYLGLFYDKLKGLEPGNEVDLGKGCDYASRIMDAMNKTRQFVEANKEVVKAILNGLSVERCAAEMEKKACSPTI